MHMYRRLWVWVWVWVWGGVGVGVRVGVGVGVCVWVCEKEMYTLDTQCKTSEPKS